MAALDLPRGDEARTAEGFGMLCIANLSMRRLYLWAMLNIKCANNPKVLNALASFMKTEELPIDFTYKNQAIAQAVNRLLKVVYQENNVRDEPYAKKFLKNCGVLYEFLALIPKKLLRARHNKKLHMLLLSTINHTATVLQNNMTEDGNLRQ